MPKVSHEIFIKIPPISSLTSFYNIGQNFQWIPSLFQVTETGGVEIKSYINNLYPVHYKDLYQPIADIFSQVFPAFNKM